MGDNTQHLDRRRSPRYPCRGAAEILQSGKLWGWGKVIDISRCGCYIETTQPLPIGSQAQLRLTVGDSLLDVYANVVSTTPQFGMGMDFVVESPEQWNKLAQIVEKAPATDLSFTVLQTGGNRAETQPHMQAALQNLQRALEELREAMHDDDEGCAEILDLTENAIHGIMKLTGTVEHYTEATPPSSILRGFGLSPADPSESLATLSSP